MQVGFILLKVKGRLPPNKDEMQVSQFYQFCNFIIIDIIY